MGVADEAIQKIKAMIMVGEFRPGGRLPPEGELAARLGVSRSSLREAVRALALIQVLDVRRGDGTYVTSLEPSVLMEGTGFIVELLNGAQELELYQVRRILEPAAAALAAARIDAATIERLHDRLLRMEAAMSVPELAEADVDFHHALVEAAGNRLLTSLLDSLSAGTIRARIWRLITGTAIAESTKLEHRAIFDGIRSRDPELARAAVAVHIASGERWLGQLLEQDLEPQDLSAAGSITPM